MTEREFLLLYWTEISTKYVGMRNPKTSREYWISKYESIRKMLYESFWRIYHQKQNGWSATLFSTFNSRQHPIRAKNTKPSTALLPLSTTCGLMLHDWLLVYIWLLPGPQPWPTRGPLTSQPTKTSNSFSTQVLFPVHLFQRCRLKSEMRNMTPLCSPPDTLEFAPAVARNHLGWGEIITMEGQWKLELHQPSPAWNRNTLAQQNYCLKEYQKHKS